MVTPSHLCQNPCHAHHLSHHPSHGHSVADTVVEESTGGSIVTVISNTSNWTNDPTPDIILTNSEFEAGTHTADTLSSATQLLSPKSIGRKDGEIKDHLASPPLPAAATTAPATTEQIPNINETGTDSIQINRFSTNNYEQIITKLIELFKI